MELAANGSLRPRGRILADVRVCAADSGPLQGLESILVTFDPAAIRATFAREPELPDNQPQRKAQQPRRSAAMR
jgi:hypothetical protein